jgi:hypothetical protein
MAKEKDRQRVAAYDETDGQLAVAAGRSFAWRALVIRRSAILLLLVFFGAVYATTLNSYGMFMWDEAEYALLRANAADTCDDRVSDDIFEVEDEHADVDIIVCGIISR